MLKYIIAAFLAVLFCTWIYELSLERREADLLATIKPLDADDYVGLPGDSTPFPRAPDGGISFNHSFIEESLTEYARYKFENVFDATVKLAFLPLDEADELIARYIIKGKRAPFLKYYAEERRKKKLISDGYCSTYLGMVPSPGKTHLINESYGGALLADEFQRIIDILDVTGRRTRDVPRNKEMREKLGTYPPDGLFIVAEFCNTDDKSIKEIDGLEYWQVELNRDIAHINKDVVTPQLFERYKRYIGNQNGIIISTNDILGVDSFSFMSSQKVKLDTLDIRYLSNHNQLYVNRMTIAFLINNRIGQISVLWYSPDKSESNIEKLASLIAWRDAILAANGE